MCFHSVPDLRDLDSWISTPKPFYFQSTDTDRSKHFQDQRNVPKDHLDEFQCNTGCLDVFVGSFGKRCVLFEDRTFEPPNRGAPTPFTKAVGSGFTPG